MRRGKLQTNYTVLPCPGVWSQRGQRSQSTETPGASQPHPVAHQFQLFLKTPHVVITVTAKAVRAGKRTYLQVTVQKDQPSRR